MNDKNQLRAGRCGRAVLHVDFTATLCGSPIRAGNGTPAETVAAAACTGTVPGGGIARKTEAQCGVRGNRSGTGLVLRARTLHRFAKSISHFLARIVSRKN